MARRMPRNLGSKQQEGLVMAPVFVEVLSGDSHSNVEICRKIVSLLVKEHIPPPFPFASSAEELESVLRSMSGKGIEPSVFIVNELYAELLIATLDEVAGNIPMLLFRREICQPLAKFKNDHRFVELSYGSKTSDEIAARVAKMLVAYFADGDMSRFETYAQDRLMAVLMEDTDRSMGRKSGRHSAIRPL
jgi:hypothetical protein